MGIVTKIRPAYGAFVRVVQAELKAPSVIGRPIRKYSLPGDKELTGPGGWHAGPKKIILPQIKENGFFELHNHLYFTTHGEGPEEIVHFGENGVRDVRELVLIDFSTESRVADEEDITFGTRRIPVEEDVYIKATYEISDEYIKAQENPIPLFDTIKRAYAAAMDVINKED
ncbi:hypothetical protein K0U07_01355 [bacterium]|nr:hypothetical protein [bacterium]